MSIDTCADVMLAFLSALAIAVGSCVLNVVVISTVISTRSMQHIGYYYVASQATCNLICAVLGAPPQALRQLMQAAYIDLICVLFIFLDTFYCNVFFLNTVSALLDCVFEQLRLLKLQRVHYNDKLPLACSSKPDSACDDAAGQTTDGDTLADAQPLAHLHTQRPALFDQKRVRMKLALPWLLSCVQTVAMFAVTSRHSGFLHRSNLCLHDNLNFLSLRALLTIVVPCLVAVVLLLIYLRNSKRSIAHVIKQSSKNPRRLAKQRVRKWLHPDVDADSESESGVVVLPRSAHAAPSSNSKNKPLKPAAILKGANAHAAARTASFEGSQMTTSTTVTLAPITCNSVAKLDRPFSNGHLHQLSDQPPELLAKPKPTVTFSDVAVVYTTSTTKRDFSLPDLHALTKAGDTKRKEQQTVQHSRSSHVIREREPMRPPHANNGRAPDSRPQVIAHLLSQLHSLGTICRINLVSLITTACTWAIYIVGNLLYVIFGFNRSAQQSGDEISSPAPTQHQDSAYYVLLYFRWAAYAGCAIYPLLVLVIDDACRGEVKRKCCYIRRSAAGRCAGETQSSASDGSQPVSDDDTSRTGHCHDAASNPQFAVDVHRAPNDVARTDAESFPYRPPPSPPRHSASVGSFPPFVAAPPPLGYTQAEMRGYLMNSEQQVANHMHEDVAFRFYTMNRPAPLSRSDPAFIAEASARPSSFRTIQGAKARNGCTNKTTHLHPDDFQFNNSSLSATLPNRANRKVSQRSEKVTASISPIRKVLIPGTPPVDNEEDSLLMKARTIASPSLQLQNINSTAEYF